MMPWWVKVEPKRCWLCKSLNTLRLHSNQYGFWVSCDRTIGSIDGDTRPTEKEAVFSWNRDNRR
jgi:hypothetical protein